MNKFVDQKIFISIIIIVAVFLVYQQVSHFEFVSYDDHNYIPYTSKALSLKNITEVFLSMNYANWHPLTWLSLMIDYNLYGANAGGYHVTNLILHIINSLLLFLLLCRMTGATYRSAFVAFLFALHPLHVESVAWVTERKDVLSTMFWLLTMWAYVSYTKKPNLLKYLPVVVFLILGLMSKPMLVTLPFVLLLMDYWPLGRANFGQNISSYHLDLEKKDTLFLLIEKIPLFIIAMASSVITFIAQNSFHAVASFEKFSLYDRILNTIHSYAVYLWKIFWFKDLSPFYIYSKNFEILQISMLLAFLLAVTFAAIVFIRKIPYLAFGWFWYLGTLVPVIGLIQVGSQAMADRYTYVPMIGIFIVMAWGIPQLLSGLKYGKIIAGAAAFLFIALVTFATFFQVGIWKNNVTLFGYVISLDPHNADAYQVIGHVMTNNGENEKALYYYYMALQYNPKFYQAYNNAGTILQKMGRPYDAMNCYRKALQINDQSVEANCNLGIVLYKMGKSEEAVHYYRKALQIDNKSAETNYNLGLLLIEKNHLNEAISYLKKALEITPGDYDTQNNLGVALMKNGDIQEAMVHFQEASRLNPQRTEAEKNMRIAVDVRKQRMQGKNAD